MPVQHEPANMGEEESSFGVVRIGVGVGELVMNSVVLHPLVDVSLQRQKQKMNSTELDYRCDVSIGFAIEQHGHFSFLSHLVGNGLHDHQYDAQRPFCFVRPMAP